MAKVEIYRVNYDVKLLINTLRKTTVINRKSNNKLIIGGEFTHSDLRFCYAKDALVLDTGVSFCLMVCKLLKC